MWLSDLFYNLADNLTVTITYQSLLLENWNFLLMGKFCRFKTEIPVGLDANKAWCQCKKEFSQCGEAVTCHKDGTEYRNWQWINKFVGKVHCIAVTDKTWRTILLQCEGHWNSYWAYERLEFHGCHTALKWAKIYFK